LDRSRERVGDASARRVLFAIGGLRRGGSELQLVELLTRVHPEGVQATVVTWDPQADAENRERLAEGGVAHVAIGPIHAARPLRPALGMARLARVFRAVRPDVAYAWLEQASVLLGPVARAHGVPVVVARRNVSGASVERFPPAALAIRRAERLAVVVTGNSEAVLAAARQRGIRSERLRLVRNGHPDVPPLPAPDGDRVSVGYLAQLRAEKGHLRLLDALELLRSPHTWGVDVAGEGPLRATIEAEVARRGLGNRVRLVGAVTDARGFWATRSIAALLSDHEGSPNALIEAAFAGRPLLGTDTAGISEVVAPAGGLLVDRDDPRGTAEALGRLVESDAMRRQLGEGAYAQAKARFSMDAFVRGHLDAIFEAAATRAERRRRGDRERSRG